jgi:hypothetical protein
MTHRHPGGRTCKMWLGVALLLMPIGMALNAYDAWKERKSRS